MRQDYLFLYILKHSFENLSIPITTSSDPNTHSSANSISGTSLGKAMVPDAYLPLISITPLCRECFTPQQCEIIKYISGFFMDAQKHANNIKFLLSTSDMNHNDIDPTVLDNSKERIEYLENLIQERDNKEIKDGIQIRVLQEYLVNELNRTETLDNKLKELESYIVNLEEEKNVYMKKLSEITCNDEKARFEYKDLMNRYIMKKFDNKRFFGMVTDYNDPYFMVRDVISIFVNCF